MSALNGVRIVELAGSVAGEYCGKLLADFGAEVVKVEAPGCGSPTRAMTPESLFAYLNTDKRSVVLDASGDNEQLDELIASAHAVIGDQRLSSEAACHPDVVFCSITPFGHDAPADLRNAEHKRQLARCSSFSSDCRLDLRDMPSRSGVDTS